MERRVGRIGVKRCRKKGKRLKRQRSVNKCIVNETVCKRSVESELCEEMV